MTVVNVKTDSFFFSLHAEDQLSARSKMNRSDVIRLLEQGLKLPIGTDKHRIHTLIYSVIDATPYVIIYDERNKEIVTFLYVDYHNKFVVFDDAINKIKLETLNHKPKNRKQIQQSGNSKKSSSPIEWMIVNAQMKQIKDTGIADVYLVSQSKGTEGYIRDYLFNLNTAEFDDDITKISNYKFLKRVEDKRAALKIEKSDVVSVSIKERLTGHTIKMIASRQFIKDIKEVKKN